MKISPDSMRSVSTAANPYGAAPALVSVLHRPAAFSGLQKISYPSSPEYPVRETQTGTPPTRTCSGKKRK